MVSRLLKRGRVIFQCEYCGFGYEDLGTSERCEEFCATHGSCSTRITRTAVYVPSVRNIPLTAA